MQRGERQMKRPIVIGNWKANKTVAESIEFMQQFKSETEGFDFGSLDVVITPSFLAMSSIKDYCDKAGIGLGAQNVDWHGGDSYCGGYPARLIAEFCSYAFAGHSEQRQFYEDTDERVAERVKAALKEKLIPIICIGENEECYRKGKTFSYLGAQIERSMGSLNEEPKEMVILYEPVWALGTGIHPEPDYINKVFSFIRDSVKQILGEEWYNKVRFIYAGSVTPHNAGEYIRQENIDGLAVGSASLDAARFAEIVRRCRKVFSEK